MLVATFPYIAHAKPIDEVPRVEYLKTEYPYLMAQKSLNTFSAAIRRKRTEISQPVFY